MNRPKKRNAVWLLILTLVAHVGCSSPSIVGVWQGDDQGTTLIFTFFSDGTGDLASKGKKTKPITWRRVADKFEVALADKTAVVTLRENGTLSVQAPYDAELGLLILKKKKD